LAIFASLTIACKPLKAS